MDPTNRSLFREEAIAHRADRLAGRISIAVPTTWQAVGYLMFGSVAAALLFLSVASYSRIERVAGRITPDRGLATILPTRGGVVTRVAVAEGQQVLGGDPLVLVRVEEDSTAGASVAARIESSIATQDRNLEAQARAAQEGAAAQQRQLAAEQQGLSAEITEIGSQIELQRELLASGQRDLERARTIAMRGFISGRDLSVREEVVLSRRQQLAQLSQSFAQRRAALQQAERNASHAEADARAEAARLTAARAALAREAAAASGERAYLLRAPVAGRVTALIARPGQPADPRNPLMVIVPSGSVLRADLAVPSSAVGFIKPGQEVRLAIDAFPYERFGTVPGRVLSVATSPLSQSGQDAAATPVYTVSVGLDAGGHGASGREHSLVPGMTLTAHIVTDRRSLLEWLLEPLARVGRR